MLNVPLRARLIMFLSLISFLKTQLKSILDQFKVTIFSSQSNTIISHALNVHWISIAFPSISISMLVILLQELISIVVFRSDFVFDRLTTSHWKLDVLSKNVVSVYGMS